jgi:hypothetical protein
LGSSITKDVGCRHEAKSRITMTKTELNKTKVLLTSKLNFNVRKKPVKHGCIVLKLEYFGKYMKSTFEVLKC